MATFQTYPVPPPHYASYNTPPPTGGYGGYYSPRHYAYASTPYTSTPSKGHTRRATGDGTTFTYTYTASTPRKQTHYSTPEYAYYNTSAQSTPQRKADYVSGSERKRESTRTYRVSTDDTTRPRKSTGSKQYSSRSKYVDEDYHHYYNDRSYEYLPRYQAQEERPPPYQRQKSYHHDSGARADQRSRPQVNIYTTTDSSKQTIPRSTSFW